MFHFLNSASRIFVTGPHRSGTRICSRMIGHDLNYRVVDETEVWDSWHLVNQLRPPCVIHCPLLMPTLWAWRKPDDAIVLMRRDADMCIASARRTGITVDDERYERDVWCRLLGVEDKGQTQAQFKYDAWDQVISQRLSVTLHEVNYQSLSQHPLWVPPEQRVGWAWNRTQSHD